MKNTYSSSAHMLMVADLAVWPEGGVQVRRNGRDPTGAEIAALAVSFVQIQLVALVKLNVGGVVGIVTDPQAGAPYGPSATAGGQLLSSNIRVW
jgi:hypothetical protein